MGKLHNTPHNKGKKQHRLLLPFMLFMYLLPCKAQQILVCDAISRFPLRDVRVWADGKPIGKTIYLGTITLPDGFRTATFQKEGFLKETLKRNEVLCDTVFLFPAKHSLDEVVVTGKARPNVDEMNKNTPKRDLKDVGYLRSTLGGFDLATIVDMRLKRDRKHAEQNRKIFKKLDGDDPILRAYAEEKANQETLKRKLELMKADSISVDSITKSQLNNRFSVLQNKSSASQNSLSTSQSSFSASQNNFATPSNGASAPPKPQTATK